MTAKALSFGDTVRVRTTSVTKDAGLADLVGTVHGETTPSVTGVDVIGELEADYAINVYFEDNGADVWFEPRLLQFVDHGAGAEIELDGVNKKWVRSEDGEWVEHATGAQSGGAQSRGAQSGGAQSGGAQSGGAQSGGAQSGKDRPWWKVW